MNKENTESQRAQGTCDTTSFCGEYTTKICRTLLARHPQQKRPRLQDGVILLNIWIRIYFINELARNFT
jgi:hypothetical protein